MGWFSKKTKVVFHPHVEYPVGEVIKFDCRIASCTMECYVNSFRDCGEECRIFDAETMFVILGRLGGERLDVFWQYFTITEHGPIVLWIPRRNTVEVIG